MGRHTLGRYKQVSRDWVSAVLFWFYTDEIMLFCFSHFPFLLHSKSFPSFSARISSNPGSFAQHFGVLWLEQALVL